MTILVDIMIMYVDNPSSKNLSSLCPVVKCAVHKLTAHQFSKKSYPQVVFQDVCMHGDRIGLNPVLFSNLACCVRVHKLAVVRSLHAIKVAVGL